MLDCTSAPSWRLKIWNSASTLLLCIDCQRPDVPLPHFRSALTGKDLKFHVRTYVLHWLPKMWSSASASALPLCLYCQICEVLLPRFRSAFNGKDLKFRFSHLFCQDFQICEVPLPHFISAWTSKDLQFRFCTFAQSWLPKIWRSASPLTLCLHCHGKFRLHTSLLHWLQKICSFTFQTCLHSQRCERTSALPWLPKFCLLSSAVGSYYIFSHNFVPSYMKD